jgi:RNA polymerase sigma factor (sigma-70 family)
MPRRDGCDLIDVAEILADCRAGRSEPFRALVEQYGPGVRAVARGLLCNRAAADEAAQEAFCRAFSSLNRLRNPRAFFPWLLGITEHVAREMRRARPTARLQAADELSRPPAPPDRTPVLEAVAQLPAKYRDPIVLRYFVGASGREAAALLKLSPTALNKRLSRAYALLRDGLRGSDLDAVALENAT